MQLIDKRETINSSNVFTRTYVNTYIHTYIHYLHKSHNTPLYNPPKICTGIVFDFSWDIFMSQENLQTMIMQNFRGGKRGVLWDCASSEHT